MYRYIIGDVHGCFYTLQKLIAKLPKEASLIFVGDLVDKGNFSKETVEFVMQNGYPCILGNHEYLMLLHIEEVLDGKSNPDWFVNSSFGGYKTVENYRNDPQRLQEHLTWIKTLPRYIEIENYFITHAFGLPYYKRKNLQSSHTALMSNRPSDIKTWGWDWEEGYEQYDIINIYGHDVVKEIETDKNHIGIDTGCVYGNQLTALELGTMRCYTQEVDSRDIK